MLRDPLSLEQQMALREAADAVLVTYELVLGDKKTMIPTPLHAAIFQLKQALGKPA